MAERMIQVTVGNNLSRHPVTVPNTQTLKKTLEDANIDYTSGMTTLDGSTLQPGDINKSFEQLGVQDRCFLLNVVKADNA